MDLVELGYRKALFAGTSAVPVVEDIVTLENPAVMERQLLHVVL